jgi:hypothetical protein
VAADPSVITITPVITGLYRISGKSFPPFRDGRKLFPLRPLRMRVAVSLPAPVPIGRAG